MCRSNNRGKGQRARGNGQVRCNYNLPRGGPPFHRNCAHHPPRSKLGWQGMVWGEVTRPLQLVAPASSGQQLDRRSERTGQLIRCVLVYVLDRSSIVGPSCVANHICVEKLRFKFARGYIQSTAKTCPEILLGADYGIHTALHIRNSTLQVLRNDHGVPPLRYHTGIPQGLQCAV